MFYHVWKHRSKISPKLHTGRPPFSEHSNEAAVMFSVLSGNRPLPRGGREISQSLWMLINWCWTREMPNRPSMRVVAKLLESGLQVRLSV